jgi:hypothetical protein
MKPKNKSRVEANKRYTTKSPINQKRKGTIDSNQRGKQPKGDDHRTKQTEGMTKGESTKGESTKGESTSGRDQRVNPRGRPTKGGGTPQPIGGMQPKGERNLMEGERG